MSLTKVDLPKVHLISDRTFKNCTSLKSIHIGSDISSFWGNIFEGCTQSDLVITIDKKSSSDIEYYGGVLPPWGAINAKIIWNG